MRYETLPLIVIASVLLIAPGCPTQRWTEQSSVEKQGKRKAPLGRLNADKRSSIGQGNAAAQSAVVEGFAGERAGEDWNDNGLKMKFCWCPPGKFTMGSPRNEKDRDDDEDQVSVLLTRGFWLGKYEVTQAQWKSVMGTEPWAGKKNVKEGDRFPATFVSREDAVKFCAKLATKDRLSGKLPVDWNYRLPTEGQWEYACRAQSRTSYSFGNDGSQLVDYAWFNKNAHVGQEHAHRVGTKRSNAWGLHDMHGNVLEWCRDWYQKKLPGGKNPDVTTRAPSLVVRGGSWLDRARCCRSAYRVRAEPGDRFNFLGFRVAIVQTNGDEQ